MAFEPLPLPLYPDVPPAPGVPSVLRAAGGVIGIITTLQALDQQFFGGLFTGIQWGIFDQGLQPVIVGDSCVGVAFRKEYRIADYPIEGGGFASYNKVETPYDAKITLTAGGSDASRAAFLQDVDDAVASLYLFNVVTPEVVYPRANLVHYDYRRTQRAGVSLLTVDIWLQEVREAAAAEFTQTKTPAGAETVNTGTVQATSPSFAQSGVAGRLQ